MKTSKIFEAYNYGNFSLKTSKEQEQLSSVLPFGSTEEIWIKIFLNLFSLK